MFLHRAISKKWVFVMSISDAWWESCSGQGCVCTEKWKKLFCCCFSDIWSDFEYMRLEFAFWPLGRWERSRGAYRKVKGSVVASWISCGHPVDSEFGRGSPLLWRWKRDWVVLCCHVLHVWAHPGHGESSLSLIASANVYSGKSISSEGIHKSTAHPCWSLQSHSDSHIFMPLLPLN